MGGKDEEPRRSGDVDKRKKRATWYKSWKESRKREKAPVMSEDLIEYVTEATKAKEELKESFKDWLAIHSEAEIILEARNEAEEDLRRSTLRHGTYLESKARISTTRGEKDPLEKLGRSVRDGSGARVVT